MEIVEKDKEFSFRGRRYTVVSVGPSSVKCRRDDGRMVDMLPLRVKGLLDQESRRRPPGEADRAIDSGKLSDLPGQ